jgi:tetratricopeptide (TPR) repeat protein
MALKKKILAKFFSSFYCLQSAALVSGFYTSQLLCLYRRNHRFIAENSRCYYSNYLYNKTQAVHRNISYLLTQAGQQNLIENVKQIATTCPFQSTKAEPKEVVNLVDKKRSIVDEFKDFKHFIDPGFHRYQQFFEPQDKPLNTNNDKNHKETKTSQSTNVDSEYKSENKSHKKSQDEIIDETIIQLAKIVGEIEFELGVQCYRAGKFEEAVNHFKLSSGHKHAGSIFNLALCYEDGLGVKKNMKTARKLYEIASELGHAKATYNLGVYYANGYGGVDKNFKQAKKCFTQAMELGNADAKKAMKLVKPKVKLPVIDEYEEFLYNNNNNINKNLNVMEQPSLVRIAVT